MRTLLDDVGHLLDVLGLKVLLAREPQVRPLVDAERGHLRSVPPPLAPELQHVSGR